ncbi:MAG: Gfo/Idh/MocA family protein [Symbiobacteriia bacterium]
MSETLADQGERLRLVVLGPGGIAQKAHLPVLVDEPGVEVVGLWGRTLERTAPVAERFRVPALTGGLAEALGGARDDGAAAAVVLTATDSHLEVAAAALERGLDVLLEKPISRNLADAQALVKLAADRGRILMVAFNRRYAPLYVAAHQRLVGRPALLVAEKLRTHVGDDLVTAVIDDAIHQLDLLRWFGGEVERVEAQAQLHGSVFRSLLATFRFAGGGMGSLTLSHVAGIWQERLTCHEGRRSLEVMNMDLLHSSDGGGTSTQGFGTWTPTLERRGFVHQARHFIACCRDRSEPLTSGRDAVKSQELAARVLAAAE